MRIVLYRKLFIRFGDVNQDRCYYPLSEPIYKQELCFVIPQIRVSLSLSNRKKRIKSVIYDEIGLPTIWWKAVWWILRKFVWKKVYFKERNDGAYFFTYLELGSYWTKVHTKFTHNVARSSQIMRSLQSSVMAFRNRLKYRHSEPEWRYFNLFRNAIWLQIKVKSDFDHKIGCHGNVFWAIGKGTYR